MPSTKTRLRSAVGIALTAFGVLIAVIVTIVMLTLGADRTVPPHAPAYINNPAVGTDPEPQHAERARTGTDVGQPPPATLGPTRSPQRDERRLASNPSSYPSVSESPLPPIPNEPATPSIDPTLPVSHAGGHHFEAISAAASCCSRT
jgi:hypothetical protein